VFSNQEFPKETNVLDDETFEVDSSESESTFLWKWIAMFFGGQFLQCIQNYAFLAPIYFILVSQWEELHPSTDPPTYAPRYLSILPRSAWKWLLEYSGMMNWATSDSVNGFPFLSSSKFPNRINTEEKRCYLTPFICCDSLDDMRKSNTTVTRHEQPIMIIVDNFGGPRASGPSVETNCCDCCDCCKAPKCNCCKCCCCYNPCLSCCDCFMKEDSATTAVAATAATVETGMAAAGVVAAAARQQQYQPQHQQHQLNQMQPSGQLAVLPSQLQMEAGLPQRQDSQPVKIEWNGNSIIWNGNSIRFIGISSMPLHVSFTDRGQRERSSLRERQGYDAETKLNLERKDLAAVYEQVKLVRDSSGSVGLILLRPHKTLGGIEIVALISGGAAEMCEELSVGDMIQSVDSTPLDNIADNQIFDMMRGKPGSVLTLTLEKLRKISFQRGASGNIGIRWEVKYLANNSFTALLILELVPDGPAEKSGQFLVGDLIYQIDQKPVHQDIESARFMFAGAAGSTITLSIAPRRASHQPPHYTQPSYQGGVYQQQGEINGGGGSDIEGRGGVLLERVSRKDITVQDLIEIGVTDPVEQAKLLYGPITVAGTWEQALPFAHSKQHSVLGPKPAAFAPNHTEPTKASAPALADEDGTGIEKAGGSDNDEAASLMGVSLYSPCHTSRNEVNEEDATFAHVITTAGAITELAAALELEAGAASSKSLPINVAAVEISMSPDHANGIVSATSICAHNMGSQMVDKAAAAEAGKVAEAVAQSVFDESQMDAKVLQFIVQSHISSQGLKILCDMGVVSLSDFTYIEDSDLAQCGMSIIDRKKVSRVRQEFQDNFA